MLVTDRRRLRGRSLDQVVSLAVEGGVNVVQLREKDLPGGELYKLALNLRTITAGRALLLVNDRIDVALAANADGVHLPEHGLPAREVRTLVAEDTIVGRSVHSVEAAVASASEATVAKKARHGKKNNDRILCPDCGGRYKAGAPHYMFCPAKNCTECGTTYSVVIQPDEDGNRICERCSDDLEEV